MVNKITINGTVLGKFLNVATLNGSIESVKLDFGLDGMGINSITQNSAGATISFIKKEAFSSWGITESFSIGVKNSKLLADLLNNFQKEVSIELTENVLTIYDEKTNAHLINMKTEFIETVMEDTSKLLSNFDDGVELDGEIFNKMIKNAVLLNNDEFLLECKNNILTITVGQKGFNTIEEKVPLTYNDFRIKVGEMVKGLVQVLSGKIRLSIMGDGKPIMLEVRKENFYNKLIIAPLTDESDEEEPIKEEVNPIEE